MFSRYILVLRPAKLVKIESAKINQSMKLKKIKLKVDNEMEVENEVKVENEAEVEAEF